MYILSLLSCGLLAIVSGIAIPKDDVDIPDLKWPVKYAFEAEKISLTAGWVEDIQYWRTSSKSRVDYNKGAVKLVQNKPRLKKRKISYGVKYEVHPETTEEKLNYLVCSRTNGTIYSRINLIDVLPDEDLFSHVGSEVIEQDTVEKLTYSDKDDSSDTRKTMWAIYDQVNNTWTPVRYEDIEYDTWYGYKKKHEIWKFINFETHFNSSNVFDFDKIYDCQDTDSDPDELSNVPSNDISPDDENLTNHIFNSFKKTHDKIYADKLEHDMRRNLFQKRMRLVYENNKKKTGYKLAINKFADRTPEEMKRYMGLIRPSQREPDTHSFPYTKSELTEIVSTLPKEFDLRDIGVITPVKDQEECGSCWTFGTTAAVEGVLARNNGGRLLRLSNQALIDCAWGFGNAGCNGGFDIGAYRWMMEHGLPTEEEYGSYANQNGFCRIDNMTEIYRIRGFTNVTPFSVDALKVALVNHGPLSVSIHVTDSLSLYNGGIFYDTDCNPNYLNHEVTLVGYGQRDGEEYWIVKNSWGQNWGVDGYFDISVRDNSCGITTEPTYPVL